jgi:hypothetical protein
MHRLRRWRGNLAVLAVTLLVLLAVAEAATRLLGAGEPPLLVFDPTVGKRFRAGFHGRVYVPEAGREVDLRFNREGLRGPDRPRAKPPGTRRVAVIGDSMIAAVATDEEHTLVRRLEVLLNTKRRPGGAPWEVLNFGVSSSSTGNELVLYREVASRYEPDVVLCAFFVGNDLADNSHRLTSAPRIYFELDEGGALRQRPFSAAADGEGLGGWLDRHSRFYMWQKTALREVRGRARSWLGRAESAHWIFSRTEPPAVAEAWRLTGKLLSAFRTEVEARGSRFAVVMIPSAEQIYDDLWQDVRRQAGEAGKDFDRNYPQERLGTLCRDAGIPLVTMTAELRAFATASSSKVPEQWLFHQGRWHLNAEGHRIAADVLGSGLSYD